MKRLEVLEKRALMDRDGLSVLPVPIPAEQAAGPFVEMSLADTFNLNSREESNLTIYLDFDGHLTSNTEWNFSWNDGLDFITPPFDIDGDFENFSELELKSIHEVWQNVAEDFSIFDVNVTTAEPTEDELTITSEDDAEWGIRVIIGGDSMDWFKYGAGGVAYYKSFGDSPELPVFVFEDNLFSYPKYIAEAASHEVGHSLYLFHDGQGTNEYYYGNDNWAPLMGVGYYAEVTQWNNGDYPGATNFENDFAVMTGDSKRLKLIGDDVTDTAPLENRAGLITTRTDVDVYTVKMGAGTLSVLADPYTFAPNPNLNIELTILDEFNNVLAVSNPEDLLSSSLSIDLPAGQYFVRVDGAADGDINVDGYTDYGSVGRYELTASFPEYVPPTVSLSTTAAALQEGSTFTYTINREGELGMASSVDWVISDGTTNGADFISSLAGTVNFLPGESSKSFTLQTANDVIVELNESFVVNLSNPANATLGTSQLTSTILNDDISTVPAGLYIYKSRLYTSEDGQTDSFVISLKSKPTADVKVYFTSENTMEGTLNQQFVTFTPLNWNVLQTVTVLPVNDNVNDGNTRYYINVDAVSEDINYNNLPIMDILVQNRSSKGVKNGFAFGKAGR